MTAIQQIPVWSQFCTWKKNVLSCCTDSHKDHLAKSCYINSDPSVLFWGLLVEKLVGETIFPSSGLIWFYLWPHLWITKVNQVSTISTIIINRWMTGSNNTIPACQACYIVCQPLITSSQGTDTHTPSENWPQMLITNRYQICGVFWESVWSYLYTYVK